MSRKIKILLIVIVAALVATLAYYVPVWVSAPQPEVVPPVAPMPEKEQVTPAPQPAASAELVPTPRPPTPEVEALLQQAQAGDAVAQFNVARCYALGEGVDASREEFFRWCRMAAEQGVPQAQYTLGCCYRDGVGVTQDAALAEEWLGKAKAQGYPAAE